ncbi:GNAT family N-acetyltransferase [Pseudomonas fontis]|uniref:GNAT family N-acetyltransferase n=1 Tax=Pseudomonas fontis TaxID=2942633 RepID=A0ABT5NQ99_9PSED|nr:GNAT family N-acetyltransferase [Pseudomonas fontis]MDD0975009.1 GNAT family N-acetyltransferase [Pseudomonas fontis]MDD0990349.1 GNAT family N-acetyltransferase [Pseudomonas fontis]
MESFNVRELSRTDAEALLAFEELNRDWFESHIDARDPAFYSLQGVAAHIDAYLSDFLVGAWHPFVVEDANGKIVGRANLKAIDSVTRSAQVGYRIDQRACGQGLATQALKHLIEQARVRWGLSQLEAYVYPENVGSRKVLDRCGFVLEPKGFASAPSTEERLVLTIR